MSSHRMLQSLTYSFRGITEANAQTLQESQNGVTIVGGYVSTWPPN